MENLNKHREAMATALNTVDQLFNNLQVTYREKEVARERFSEVNYWLTRLYTRLEQEYNARVQGANEAIKKLPVEEPFGASAAPVQEDTEHRMTLEKKHNDSKPKKKK